MHPLVTRSLLPAALCAALAPAARGQDEIDAALAQARTSTAEMRWRLVPWMHSLTAALARGKREQKPVFYFGYDGVLDTGNS